MRSGNPQWKSREFPVAVQCLRLPTFTAKGLGSIRGLGTKILPGSGKTVLTQGLSCDCDQTTVTGASQSLPHSQVW